MEIPIDTLDQNLEALATQIVALKFCSSRVVRKDPKRLEGWLESIQSAMNDFVEIRREWNKLKGDHFNILKTREALNCRVIDSLKAAIALKKVVQAIMELIETLSNEVKTDEPKQEAATHSKKEKSDKPKPEGVTLLKEVMETVENKEKEFDKLQNEVKQLKNGGALGNPKRLEENLERLSKELEGLKRFRSEIAEKKARQMQGWIETVESKEKEFDKLQNEVKQLKNGGALGARNELNMKVIQSLKSLTELKDGGDALTESIEALFSDLTGEKPKRFTHAHLISFTSNFSDQIDMKGNNVYKGKFPNGVLVVVKEMKETTAVEDIFMAEMNTMFKTSHRNVVKLYGFCFEKNMKALIFEYMPNKSLDKILFENHGDIKWEKLYYIAIETAKGLSYLHDGCDKQILHGDIKASNILLSSDLSPKVTNFGITKLMSRDNTHVTLSEAKGDPSYAAPEIKNVRRLTYKCDVYSYGMVLLEILGRRRNIKEKVHFPRHVYWEKFKNGKVEELMKECDIAEYNKEKVMILVRVAFWCIQYTPANRPSMDTVVKMLQKEIQVVMPQEPFDPIRVTQSYREVVYTI